MFPRLITRRHASDCNHQSKGHGQRFSLSFCTEKTRSRASFHRSFSTSHDTAEVQTFDVRCASTGFITVDVYNVQALANSNSPLVVYLPPLGVHTNRYVSLPDVLASFAKTTIARINYRWNIFSPSDSPGSTNPSPSHSPQSKTSAAFHNNHPFPSPLHDTLQGFDFLVNSLLPSVFSRQSISPSPYAALPSPRKIVQRPIFIYGEFLGGTLATGLGLTECHLSKKYPFTIAGLIIKDAVLDWTGIAATKDPKLLMSAEVPSHKHQGSISDQHLISVSRTWNQQDLHDLKVTLFTKPQSCFDNFASPVLFFHTSGYTVPTRWVGTNPPETEPDRFITSIISDPDEEVVDTQSTDNDSTEMSLKEKKGVEEVDMQRISYLKFPPHHTIRSERTLKLPRSLFLTTSSPENGGGVISRKKSKNGCTSSEQAEEMKRLMQRSILLYELKDRVVWDQDLDPHTAAEDRIQVAEVQPEESISAKLKNWMEDSLDDGIGSRE